MDRFFNMDNAFFTFMGRVADLLLLNILWLICCIPLVTIGPSTSALYYTALKIVRKEDSYVWKMFFHSFRQNLRQGICLTLLFMAVGFLLILDMRICGTMYGSLAQFLMAAFWFLSLLFLILLSYTFPVLAQFENSLRDTLKNAMLMALCHLPYTLLILLINLLPIFLFFFSPYYFFMSIPLWLFLGIAVLAWVNSHLFVKIFARYMPEEEIEEDVIL
ncbi:MAG: YesL family protein [Lachnospiraceae bacterium]|jgi:uncharacterized membrane protein YesL|nr:YesL family protein [Lachnospiraceae bacterium]MCI9135660.1 YesL family protein [Lachnospiraceae bacterium]